MVACPMANVLISTTMVLALVQFALMLIGAALILGRLFWGTLRRLASTEPTAADREIERLLTETDPNWH